MAKPANLELMTVSDVASFLHVTTDTFYRTWAQKVQREGFPSPLPGGKARLWDPVALRAWLDRQIPDHLDTGRRGKLTEEERAANEMDQRANQLAGMS